MTADDDAGEAGVSSSFSEGDSSRASETGASGEPDPERRYRPGETALLVDAMLGKLGTYLRMCGYDSEYVDSERGSADSRDRDALIRERARRACRTILTRDRSLASSTERAIRLQSRAVTAQLEELRAAGFELRLSPEPVRCGGCNGPLERVSPEERIPEYAPAPDETGVWRCRDCGKHFWQGSHWDDVAATLAEIR